MAHNPDEPHKRKRNDDDNGAHAERIPQPPPPQPGNTVPINYLSKPNAGKLKLIQGDNDTFSDVLTLINEYEGVLSRHESLASNLGAKLTGPRLLKAMEGLFEGPISTTPPQTMFTADPITWLDIVEFAKSKPGEFNVSANPHGVRSCQFALKGVHVEIAEDDWRLIVSGSLDRFMLVPPQPLEEDETAEAATVEILEQRLHVLIKKADEVARKARTLKYQLSGRKAGIGGKRASQQIPGTVSGFQAVNQPGRSAAPSSCYDLHADLLQQFLASPKPTNHRLPSISSVPPTPGTATTTNSTPRTAAQHGLPPMSSRPSPSYQAESSYKDQEDEHRGLILVKIDRLKRGDEINPPCDRCRRLKTSCVKHLTACQGCTKKHARCTWKGVNEEEAAHLKAEVLDGDDGDDMRPARGHDLDRDDLAGSGSARLSIGRHADESWRKGPGSSSRDDLMDIDLRQQPRRTTESESGAREGRPREHVLLQQMATAAADAASRGTPPRSS